MTDKENKPHEGGVPNAGTMAGHDDWATPPPMADIEAGLFKAYAKELFIREMTVYNYRLTRMTNKVQRYFNSTPTRNALARVLCLSTYVNQPYTKTEISEQLGVSRQAVHDLIEECIAEGWAELAKPESRKRYRASPTLIEAGEDYARFNYDTVADSGVALAYDALHSYHKLRQVS